MISNSRQPGKLINCTPAGAYRVSSWLVLRRRHRTTNMDEAKGARWRQNWQRAFLGEPTDSSFSNKSSRFGHF